MECLKMIKVRHGDVTHIVPCGKCAFCLENKRSSWMFRIYHEMRTQLEPGWFVTLTYDERHVRRTADGRLSLRFYDVQLFFKKLRKAKFYVKYICVGEYGSKTARPHYHMLLWTDCKPEALQEYWTSKKGTVLGSIHIGRISMQSAMYTLKYIIQPKQKEVDGIEKTRAQFSKGLGLGYLTSAMYDYHTFDYERPQLIGMADGRKVALPRYYRTKIFTKYQLRKEGSRVKWESIRKRRRKMRELLKQGIRNTADYIFALRTERARMIIQKSKVNEQF